MNPKLKALYKTVILKHNQHPFHYEKKETATHKLDAYNPLCGDRFQLYLTIKDRVIKTAFFHGYGCAISKASTSILAKNLEGQTLESAIALCKEFQQIVTEGQTTDKEDLAAFAAAKDFPGRLQCATLGWDAVQDFICGNSV